MPETPKLRRFQTWEQTSIPANGNKTHPASGEKPAEDRKANVTRAAFFIVVALIFVLVNHLGYRKNLSDENPNNLPSLVMTVSSPSERQPGDRTSSRMLFRLRNIGKHSLFYAGSKETNLALGEIVSRTSVSSKWMTPSGLLEDQSSASDELSGKAVAWIEMPPEGWVDGQFQDVEDFPGEHAYAIFVKPSQEGKIVRTFSNSYRAEGK